MLARTPGYCTLIARSVPSGSTARCTCPMDAAAKGRTSKRAKRLYHPGPHSAFSTVCSCFGGMWRASSRIRDRIAVNSPGSTIPVSMDSICPSFSAAPRRCDSPSVSRRVLAGVSSSCARSGRLPPANARRPPAATLPAMPVAIPPKCHSRAVRPVGTAAPLLSLSSGKGTLPCQVGRRCLRNRRRCQR